VPRKKPLPDKAKVAQGAAHNIADIISGTDGLLSGFVMPGLGVDDRSGETYLVLGGLAERDALDAAKGTGGNGGGRNKQTDPLSVFTDQLDYAPGETVEITVTGVTVGGTVTFNIEDDPLDPGDDGDADIYEPFTIVDGGEGDLDGLVNGSITAAWTVPTTGDPNNATLNLTATDWGRDGELGTRDDRMATTTFTDDVSVLANIEVSALAYTENDPATAITGVSLILVSCSTAPFNPPLIVPGFTISGRRALGISNRSMSLGCHCLVRISTSCEPHRMVSSDSFLSVKKHLNRSERGR